MQTNTQSECNQERHVQGPEKTSVEKLQKVNTGEKFKLGEAKII